MPPTRPGNAAAATLKLPVALVACCTSAHTHTQHSMAQHRADSFDVPAPDVTRCVPNRQQSLHKTAAPSHQECSSCRLRSPSNRAPGCDFHTCSASPTLSMCCAISSAQEGLGVLRGPLLHPKEPAASLRLPADVLHAGQTNKYHTHTVRPGLCLLDVAAEGKLSSGRAAAC